MLKRTALVSFILSLSSLSSISEACSALVFNQNKPATVAVNVDWKFREGAAIIHPREETMTSGVDSAHYTPMTWKSKYGSLIFHGGNHFQPGPAVDGMNEKGLTASILMLPSSVYPSVEGKPALNTGNWVQYVLDNFQTVQEVIDDSANYQLVADNYRGVILNFHMILNDADGKSAILEYLNGKMVVHTQDNMTPPVLTNNDYDSSISALSQYSDFGGSQPLPGAFDSLSRFVRAAYYLKVQPHFVAKEEHIAYAFHGLGAVAQAPGSKSPTQLSMVFDIPTKTAYFRSSNDAAVRIVPLDSFNFSEQQELLGLNVFQHLAGDVVKQFRTHYGLTK